MDFLFATSPLECMYVMMRELQNASSLSESPHPTLVLPAFEPPFPSPGNVPVVHPRDVDFGDGDLIPQEGEVFLDFDERRARGRELAGEEVVCGWYGIREHGRSLRAHVFGRRRRRRRASVSSFLSQGCCR
jgi:hypothetical protein